MSVYGYPRQTTPNLDRVAQWSIVYHQHRAAGNFTTLGTASLLTGVYPWTHRAVHLHGTVLELFVEKSLFTLFDFCPGGQEHPKNRPDKHRQRSINAF